MTCENALSRGPWCLINIYIVYTDASHKQESTTAVRLVWVVDGSGDDRTDIQTQNDSGLIGG